MQETENCANVELDSTNLIGNVSTVSDGEPDTYIVHEASTIDYPVMTDIEERYEIPEHLILICHDLGNQIKTGGDAVVDKDLNREWFSVSAKQNSSSSVVEDFLHCVTECATKAALPLIINSFDLNGNCALHYAISHANLDVVSAILRTEAADLNIFNKAGYTPVMLTALVDSSGKQDLTPLVRLFKAADLDLQSKKVNRPGSSKSRVC